MRMYDRCANMHMCTLELCSVCMCECTVGWNLVSPQRNLRFCVCVCGRFGQALRLIAQIQRTWAHWTPGHNSNDEAQRRMVFRWPQSETVQMAQCNRLIGREVHNLYVHCVFTYGWQPNRTDPISIGTCVSVNPEKIDSLIWYKWLEFGPRTQWVYFCDDYDDVGRADLWFNL